MLASPDRPPTRSCGAAIGFAGMTNCPARVIGSPDGTLEGVEVGPQPDNAVAAANAAQSHNLIDEL